MPAPGPVSSDAVGLHARGHGSCPSESDPPDLGHPHPSVGPVELFDVVRLEPDLPEAFMHASLTPRRAAMAARKEIPHRLGEVPQRLLLHRVRPGRQPLVFGTDLGQLRRLLVVTRGAAARLPQLLLLYGQIPHKPRMPAMLQQDHLLGWCWQQSEPRHTRKVATGTDTKRHCKPARAGIGVPPRHKCRSFQTKEV